MQRTHGSDLDELDDLQVVTRREFRRGYQAQVNGRLMRLRYRKIMAAGDSMLLVHRPGAGEERPKRSLASIPRTLGTLLIVGWPLTLIAVFAIVVLLVAASR